MKHTYKVHLDEAGLYELQWGLDEYERWIKERTATLARRLAEIGVERAEVNWADITYDGDEDHALSIEQRGENRWAVKVSGTTVLFVEFGAGLIGYGHPEPHGLGPGTFPGKGHWNDPRGWVYGGVGSGASRVPLRSHGNQPNMPMYKTVKEVESLLKSVAKEVFS